MQVYRLHGPALLELAAQFPSMHHHLRWCAVRLATQRYLLLMASDGFRWLPMASHGFPRLLMASHGS